MPIVDGADWRSISVPGAWPCIHYGLRLSGPPAPDARFSREGANEHYCWVWRQGKTTYKKTVAQWLYEIYTGEVLPPRSRMRFYDSNPHNLTYDNLVPPVYYRLPAYLREPYDKYGKPYPTARPGLAGDGYLEWCWTDDEGKARSRKLARHVVQVVSGRPIPAGREVHHVALARPIVLPSGIICVKGGVLDNHPENLRLLPKAEHRKLHKETRSVTSVEKPCAWCGHWSPIEDYPRRKGSRGVWRAGVFCCSCVPKIGRYISPDNRMIRYNEWRKCQK